MPSTDATNQILDWRCAGVAPVTLIDDAIHVLASVVDGKLKLLKGRRLPPEVDPIAAAERVLRAKGNGAIDVSPDLCFDVSQCKMRVYYPVVDEAVTSEEVQWAPLYNTANLGVEPTFPFVMACSKLKQIFT